MVHKHLWVCCSFLSPLQRSEVEDSSGWRGFLSSMGLSVPTTLCRLAPPALRLNQRRMLQGKAPDIPEHVLRLAGVGPDKLRAEWSFPAFIAMFLPEFPHKAVPGHEHFQVKLTSNTKLTDLENLFFLFPQSHECVWHVLFFPRCFNTFLCLLSVPKPSRCWVTSPKVPLDPYWKWKTRPNKRHMLSKSVFYDKTQSSLLSLQLSNLYCVHQVIPKAEILRLGVLEQSKEEVIIQVGIQNWPFKIMTQNVSWHILRAIFSV